jgi:hypothetical protein
MNCARVRLFDDNDISSLYGPMGCVLVHSILSLSSSVIHLFCFTTAMTKTCVGADCLKEGSIKLQSAVQESEVDNKTELMLKIDNMISPMKLAAYHLEEAGASLMKREKVDALGKQLICCGEALEVLSAKVLELSVLEDSSSSISEDGTTAAPGKLSSQRMLYASQQMILAGKELTTAGDEKTSGPKGKSWIKQGR